MKISFDKNPKKNERLKGNSLTYFPNEFIVVDIETTGLNPNYDEIIEIGAIKIKNWQIIDTFNCLVQPKSYFYKNINNHETKIYINDFISDLTGITNEMLNDAETIDFIIPKFNNFINDSILAGHNFNFDLNFLYDNTLTILNKNLQNDFIDLLKISRKILPDLKNHKLKTLCKYFNISTIGIHRALQDAKNTFECLKNLNIYITENKIDTQYIFESINNKVYLDLSSIESNKNEFDLEHPLFNKTCVFSGKLEYLVRKDAAKLVSNFGGISNNNITQKTDILIIGSFDQTSNLKGDKSSKQLKAEKLILQGQDISIMDEETFYNLVLENNKNDINIFKKYESTFSKNELDYYFIVKNILLKNNKNIDFLRLDRTGPYLDIKAFYSFCRLKLGKKKCYLISNFDKIEILKYIDEKFFLEPTSKSETGKTRIIINSKNDLYHLEKLIITNFDNSISSIDYFRLNVNIAEKSINKYLNIPKI